MAAPKLLKRWKITVSLLERARRALPAVSGHDEQECLALLSQYHEFLEHNELELALDTLEELGDLAGCPGGYWRDLERAAENMELMERLSALRKKSHDATI
jgi:hypothetical protein